jgi:hypothetical protein
LVRDGRTKIGDVSGFTHREHRPQIRHALQLTTAAVVKRAIRDPSTKGGIVTEVGADVTAVRLDDHVVFTWNVPRRAAELISSA